MRLYRPLILPLLLVALLLPQLSAAFASVVGGTWTVVLCTGDGLRTVVMGPDGQPVEDAGHDSPCALVNVAALGPSTPEPAPGRAWSVMPWHDLAEQHHVPSPSRGPNLARAPPSV